ncbi:MAG: glycosyltransferase [Dysgonamonadaceae bacterium]|jgi:glycosyltransferase involved in cell wall biosynthesis|nr:glycosyltransferase [Dysgonamonadaceae bacterium]
MLSVCIPVYNYDVSRLLEALHRLLTASGIPFEIVWIDDASLPEFREKNRLIRQSNTIYIPLEQNIGRAKIRNLLAAKARYPYLLFMDCDSAIPSDMYIAQYIDICQPNIVCYGGCIYEKELKDASFSLRWKYGRQRESLTAGQRSNQPNLGFRTNNFLIDRNVFNTVTFNEAITDYGHEDTLFGIELEKNGFHVRHIDNPLIHTGLESNAIFLKKTESSLTNLLQIAHLLKNNEIDSSRYFRIIQATERLKKLRLKAICTFSFQIFRPVLIKNLLGKHPSLLLFDCYRVGFFCSIQ